MASLGPNFPGTTASLANAGTSENAEAWVNPGNVVSDNGTEATITAATYDTPDISQLLVVSNFGFQVPAGATIRGIVVEIERRDQAIGAASDNRVQLAKGTTFASLVGSNQADTALDWPTAATVKTYGTSTDLWGTTWTAAEVNASSFAVMLSVQADAANTDIFVDFIRVTVHYDPLVIVPATGATADGPDPLPTLLVPSTAWSAAAVVSAAALELRPISPAGSAQAVITPPAVVSMDPAPSAIATAEISPPVPLIRVTSAHTDAAAVAPAPEIDAGSPVVPGVSILVRGTA